MNEMNLTEFAERFQRGDFKSSYRLVQMQAGWYDWFCQDYQLAKKTQVLGSKVLSILDSPLFDKEKCYVFFKNNCPCVGPLYDQFSICDLQEGQVLFCCQHLEKGSHGCQQAHWEIYSKEHGFSEPVVQGDWRTCKKFFLGK